MRPDRTPSEIFFLALFPIGYATFRLFDPGSFKLMPIVTCYGLGAIIICYGLWKLRSEGK